MNCPKCSSLITRSSIYYSNGSPRVVCSSCGCKITDILDGLGTSDSLTKATRFEPVALDRKQVNGEWVYSYPGSNADPLTPGYERIHLTSLPEIDRHVKSESAKEQELRTFNLSAERSAWDQRTKARREETRALISRKGFSGKYFDAVCKLIDRNRDKKYVEMERKQVAFHNQAMSFDASNRQEYRDDTSGKRGR